MPEVCADRIRTIIGEAQALAGDNNVLVRVAGERVCAILADLLYELDTGADEVISLMPRVRRDSGVN